VLIKNVCPHLDDLHDGRPIETGETAVISADDFQLEHYQSRLRDGLLLVVEDEAEPLNLADIKAAIDAASDEEREGVKATFREIEERSENPRKGVLEATKPSDKETT
jgi:hypothetical protein